MAFITMCWNRAVQTQCYKNIVTCNHCVETAPHSLQRLTNSSKFTCIRFCIKFGKLATVVLETLPGFWQRFFWSIIDFEWILHFKASQMPVEDDEHQGNRLLVKYGNMETILRGSLLNNPSAFSHDWDQSVRRQSPETLQFHFIW